MNLDARIGADAPSDVLADLALAKQEIKCLRLDYVLVYDDLRDARAEADALRAQLAEKQKYIDEHYTGAATAYIKELEGIVDDLKAQLAEERAKREGPRQEMRFINATPDPDYPARILRAYLEEGSTWSDNTLGLPPENPICKLMNELTEKRNVLLREALGKLATSSAPDATALREADLRVIRDFADVAQNYSRYAIERKHALAAIDRIRAALLRSEPRGEE